MRSWVAATSAFIVVTRSPLSRTLHPAPVAGGYRGSRDVCAPDGRPRTEVNERCSSSLTMRFSPPSTSVMPTGRTSICGCRSRQLSPSMSPNLPADVARRPSPCRCTRGTTLRRSAPVCAQEASSLCLLSTPNGRRRPRKLQGARRSPIRSAGPTPSLAAHQCLRAAGRRATP